MTRRRRGGIKRGESNLANNQFCMCCPQSGTPREVHRVTWRREGGMEIEMPMRRGGGVKRRETNLASNQIPTPGLDRCTLAQEKATHSSILAWRIPGTGHPGGLPSMGEN